MAATLPAAVCELLQLLPTYFDVTAYKAILGPLILKIDRMTWMFLGLSDMWHGALNYSDIVFSIELHSFTGKIFCIGNGDWWFFSVFFSL